MKSHTALKKTRKRQAGRLRRVLGALVLAMCLAAPQGAGAVDTQIVYSSSGKAMFELNFYNEGEAPEGLAASVRDATEIERQSLAIASGIWADILAPGSSNSGPIGVDVTTSSAYNAFAGGYLVTGEEHSISQALYQIAYGGPSADAGRVEIGLGISSSSGWDLADHLSPVPITEGSDLVATLVHEYGHFLGMVAETVSTEDGGYRFATEDEGFSVWSSHLWSGDTQAQPGMTIALSGTGDDTDAGTEDAFAVGRMGSSGVTFRGDNVSEVLDGALNSELRIEGWEPAAGDTVTVDLSHVELAHGLMSHQRWSNYTTFMEAELAVLQDLGYSIDRKNWFGYSVYGSNLTLTNTNGYWARNEDGTAYLEGEANTATLGVGLHVYGSYNTITQAADLLACGTAGTGIRVDGSENKITVAEGVTVAADGEYGTGLLVSYGKDHEIVSAGTITANGTGGIAVRFDFGSNNNGDEVQYRGSWLWGSWNSDTKEWVSNSFTDAYNEDVGQYYDESGWPLNLDGALVKSFDISGTIEGSAAAVYIAARAYVQQINVLSGAAVTGDIISDWDPENKLIQYEVVNTDRSNADLTTLITFGRLAGENGQATSEADPDFSLAYSGNITGSKSLQLEVSGGSLEYSGTASVLSVTVKEGAELTGSGSYALSTIFADTENEKGGLFLNEGTFAPDTGLAAGDSAEDVTAVSIKGDYTQTSTGTLSLGFNGSAAANSLSITGAAVLAGALELAPVQDYYSGSVTLALADLVSAESLTIAEDGLAAAVSLASPTLTMTLAAEGEGTDTAYTIGTSRAANAYSQYAASGQQTDIARNFDELGQQDLTDLSGDAGDARNLLAAMDFSAADGSDLASAYKQLGPDTHTRAAQAVLDLQRTLTSQVVAGRLLSQAGTPAASAKASGQAMAAGDESAATGARVFATPMGGRNVNFASGGSDTSYYGLLAGAETDLALGQDNLTLGVHAAFLHIEGSAHTDDDITGDSLSLGLHGRWDPDMNLDAGAFGSVSPYVFGLARGGIETRHTDRKVAFNGFNRTAESDWTAPTFSAALGTGLDIRPSGTPGDSLVFGPVLWLDYTALWRPAFTEDNGRAADLDVEAATYQSLRSSLGARMNVRLHEGPDAARLAGSLDLSLAAVWNHEYLYDNGGTKASFAHFGSSSFTDRADVEDRDTFGGTLQLTGHLSDNVTLSLFGGIEEGRSTSDAHGGASLVWSF